MIGVRPTVTFSRACTTLRGYGWRSRHRVLGACLWEHESITMVTGGRISCSWGAVAFAGGEAGVLSQAPSRLCCRRR